MTQKSNVVGRCIYCDSTTDLSREHVIPQGLGGRLAPTDQHEAMVLRDASCEPCREKTAAIEEQCLRKMMGHFRAKHGFVRKDRKRDVLRVKFTSTDGTVTYQDVDPRDFPSAMLLPMFGEPGLFSGVPIGGPYKIRLSASVERPQEILETDGSYAAAGVGPDIFGQMLAKIGLGYAVLELGIDGFKPLVREFILGRIGEFGHWIGGPITHPPEPPSNSLHELCLAFFKCKDQEPEYVAVYIRLFANLGLPRNYVVVGQTH